MRHAAVLAEIARRDPWLLAVIAVYFAAYGWLLVATDFLPYVMDNNESFSSLWHARSLYDFGVGKSWGLADEAFSPHAAAHPHEMLARRQRDRDHTLGRKRKPLDSRGTYSVCGSNHHAGQSEPQQSGRPVANAPGIGLPAWFHPGREIVKGHNGWFYWQIRN